MANEIKIPEEFLSVKLGHHINTSHPFIEKDIDYEDIINWLQEYADQFKVKLPTDEEKFLEHFHNKRFLFWLKNEIQLCNLSITACGVNEEAKYVHKLYKARFERELEQIQKQLKTE